MLSLSAIAPRRLFAASAVVAAVAGLGAATAAAQATHSAPANRTIHTGGVTLTVPTSWHLSATVPGCVVAPGAKQPTQAERSEGVNGCQLQVITGKGLSQLSDGEHFFYGGPGDPAQCVRGNSDVGWATKAAATRRYPHATYEFRSFTRPCVSRPAEQWFAAGPPGVLIQRTFADSATENAARAAVESAALPAQRIGIPRSTTGLVTHVAGTQVDVQPVRLYVGAHGRVSLNPIWGPTYRIPVANPSSIVYTDADSTRHTLSLQQFLHYAKAGFPHLGAGNRAVVTLLSPDGVRVQQIHVDVATTP